VSTIDTLVFDLGGVLLDWNPRYLYHGMFEGDHKKMEWFLANVCTAEWNAEQDRGRPFTEGVREAKQRHPTWTVHIEAYQHRWPEMLAGPIAGSVNLLHTLRRENCRLLALTNWSTETFPFARAEHGFLDWFEGILVSGAEGLIKPDPAIFQLFTRRYAVDPSRALFIDDTLANVETARNCGFTAVLFRDPAQLQADLAAHGLLTEKPKDPQPL